MLNFFGKKQRTHHRNVSQRKDKCTQQSENYGLRHWFEHFSFNSLKRENWKVNDKDNDLPKNRRIHHFTCRSINFIVHKFLGNGFSLIDF